MKQNSCELSVVILTKDEVNNLEACVESARFAPEIVVIDGNSTDGTIELAKKLNCKVVIDSDDTYTLKDKRNWALTHPEVTGEWILFLDADERITPELQKELLHAIREGNPEIVGYKLCFKFMFMGKWLKHTTDYPVWHDRLVRRGKMRFVGAVGEYFDETMGKTGFIREPYLHYAMINGFDRWIEKHIFRAQLWAETIKQDSNQKEKSIDVLSLFSKQERRHALRTLGNKFLLLSPELRLMYMLFVSGGILDGIPGVVYSKMVSTFQFMIYLKVVEEEFRRKGKPL